MDDSAFAIQWKVYNSKSGGYDITTKEDAGSMPEVVWAHDETPGCSNNPNLLMEVMDIIEQREAENDLMRARAEELLSKFRARLNP